MDQRPVRCQMSMSISNDVMCRSIPDKERPWCWSEVGLLACVVDIIGGSYRVDIRSQEEEVND